MTEDDNWPEDMPSAEESMGIEDSGGVDEDIKDEIAKGALDQEVDDEAAEEKRDTLSVMIDGEQHLFVREGSCERCGSDADGVLHRDSVDVRGVTGGAYVLCDDCKEEVMPNHEEEGFGWKEF